MKPVVFWTQQATEDLLDIYTFIGLDNPSAAERMFQSLERRAELLALAPRLGMRRPEIAPSVRVLVQGLYLILYETRPGTEDGPVDAVEIIRVVHGYRDLTHVI